MSATPNQLHIYNPVAHTDTTVALPETPMNVSLRSDGLHAAVAYADAVSDVDLQAATVTQTYPNLTVASTGFVVYGAGYIYVLPGYQGGSKISINLGNGQIDSNSDAYITAGVFDPATPAIYYIQTDGLNRLDTSTGILGTSGARFPYLFQFNVCGPLAL